MARIAFLIGGVQKAGTSALARYLAAHPQVRLPAGKEAHVFDACDFDDDASPERVDQCFAGHFPAGEFATPTPERCFGDATPITLFHPLLIDRVARYNPAMRWIVLLREPAERAISHWHMRRERGDERWPLWLGLLLEHWRLAGHREDFSPASPLRRYSYRARGDYARQLDALYARFPREQVLVLFNHDLANAPEAVMDRVYAHLQLATPATRPVPARVFEGGYRHPGPDSLALRWTRWLLRRELRAMRDRHGIAWPATEASRP